MGFIYVLLASLSIQGTNLINSQFSIPDSHPGEPSKLRLSPRMRIENWELRIGQIQRVTPAKGCSVDKLFLSILQTERALNSGSLRSKAL